nr:zinc knuckle CX2CX4HX4C [Tanacetum cinerariifolium]
MNAEKAAEYVTSNVNRLNSSQQFTYAKVVCPDHVKNKEVNEIFVNSLYGYFIGKRIAYLLVEQYAWNIWSNHGLHKVMMNNSFFIISSIAVQTPDSGISNLLAVGTTFTGSGNLYCQWELSPGSGNALCILFPTILP